MPQYLSTDPNVGQTETSQKKYLSTDPNAGQETGHPILAMLARLAGGVGSALTSPAETTVIGTAIPAGIAGGSESLAQWLEGTPQDPKRIAAEAGIGAIPFGKIVKEGSMLAKMLKAGAVGATSEGGRELAKGEPLSPGSIVAQGALGAGTFGLLHSLLGLRGAKAPVAPETTPPIITQEGNTKIFRMPPTAAPPGTTAPSPQSQHFFRENIRENLSKAMNKIVPSGEDMVGSLDQAKQDALKIAGKNRLANVASERSLQGQENTADLQQLRSEMAANARATKETTSAATAARLRQEALDKGFVPGEASYGTAQSGKTPGGVTVSKRQPLVDPNAGIDEGGGGHGSSRNPGYVPKNPLDELMKTLGMRTETGNTELPISPHPDAPWGGARLPIEPPNVGPSGWVEPASVPDVSVEYASPQAAVAPEANAPIPPRTPDVAPGTTNGTAPDSPLAKFFKTRQGATGSNYRLAKEAEQAGEIPTSDYARDSHLIQIGRQPEGPLAAGAPLGSIQVLETPRTFAGMTEDEINATVKRNPDQRYVDMPKPLQRAWDELTAYRNSPEGSLLKNRSIQTPEVHGGMVEPPTSANPDTGASLADDVPDWIKNESSAIDRMKSEKGAMNPALLKLLTGVSGAAIGAPAGQYLDPDDPNAAVKGALVGGALGYSGAQGVNEMINWRNAGLLATPSAQGKKPLSDIAAYFGKAAESALSGKMKSETMPMLKQLLSPGRIARDFGDGLRHPELARDVIGDSPNLNIQPAKGLLGLVARPFAAAQLATTRAMERAGISPEEARRTLLLGNPTIERYKGDVLDKLGAYDAAEKLLQLQKYPAVRALRPFARIGTNIAVRGAQRIPGLSMVTGDPETRVARTLLGTGALAAGAATGMGDTGEEAGGGEPTSAIIRGLRRAALASYGVPFVLGESLTGPRGIRDLVYMTPGTTETIPPPAPQDTFATYGKKFGKRWIDQMLPDWLNPEPTSTETQR